MYRIGQFLTYNSFSITAKGSDDPENSSKIEKRGRFFSPVAMSHEITVLQWYGAGKHHLEVIVNQKVFCVKKIGGFRNKVS